VLSTMPHRPETSTTSPIPFFHLLERLKTTKREGWRRFGIKHGESIADHMYRMALITMLCPSTLASQLDMPRCTKMALIHDIAEALVGDITPVDGVSKTEKSRREEETVAYLTSGLLGAVPGLGGVDGAAGEDIRKIWREYEDDETMEAHFVHDVDKIELLLQMVEYERSQGGRVDLGEFSWVKEKLQLDECKAWAEQIIRERHAFWQTLGREVADDFTAQTVSTNGPVSANGSAVDAESLKKMRQEQIDEYYGK
jgi:putative hydrolases of HD superfamily